MSQRQQNSHSPLAHALHPMLRGLTLTLFLGVFLGMVFSLGACGAKDSGGGAAEDGSSASPDGASTPQGVIDGMAAAMEKDDMAGIVPFIRPEQRAILSFGLGVIPMTFLTGMAEAMLPAAAAVSGEEAEKAKTKLAEMKKAHEDLLKKYKIAAVDMSQVMGMGKDEDAMQKFANEAMGHVDHVAFLRESTALSAKFSDEDDKTSSPFDDLDLSTVVIKEDGDKAVASIPGREDDLALVKIGGRWYADLMSMK